MRSLRSQLLLGTVLATTAVLLFAGGVLYALVRQTLWAQFDQALAAKARSLASLVEQDEDGLESELLDAPLPEFAVGGHPEYYQIWLPDGSVFARSPSLKGRDLERPPDASDRPAFRTTRLPNGEPGRIVSTCLVPRREVGDRRADPAVTLSLVVGRETVTLQSTLARVRALLAAVCLGAVSLSAGLLIWIIQRRLRPVARLGRQIAGLDADDLSARVSAAGIPRELSPLADRLNELLTRLEAAFERERRFTGDVAHELRTPLAGLRAKLELALSRERGPDTYRTAMRDCLEIDLEMQRMVENLLHLARADAGQLELRRESVDVREIIRSCWEPLAAKAEMRRVRVHWQLNGPGTVETDRDKLRLVVQNILDNAVAYVNDGGQIAVSVPTKSGVIELAVSNSGCRLSPGDVGRVFDRFWQADASCHAGDYAHCGLGLPLCRAVMDRLGGEIMASASAPGTFTVVLRVPIR